MDIINFSKSDLEYIKENINENIKMLQIENPNELEQYGIQELSEQGFKDVNSLVEFKNKLQLANKDKAINKQVEDYCIWIIGMWLYLRFDDEVDDLDNPDENYRSIYGKVFRDENGKQRYYSNGIIFYDAD